MRKFELEELSPRARTHSVWLCRNSPKVQILPEIDGQSKGDNRSKGEGIRSVTVARKRSIESLPLDRNSVN